MTIPDRPLTVAETVRRITSDDLLLPGIQRSFVWKSQQIEQLFDSLVRGYPIGSMLLWRTRPGDHSGLRFRRIITDVSRASTVPAACNPPKTKVVYGVLDGQQRLTALNIGLRGSKAAPALGKHSRVLHMDLNIDVEEAGAESDRYSFSFRGRDDSDGHWFPVSDALGAKADAASLNSLLTRASIEPSASRRRVLKALVKAINSERAVRFDVESGDLDRVLNVFARINRGGTKLTYADLLVSMTTARWTRVDAREAIDDLRKQMNLGRTFGFSPDRIVKAGLVLLDLKDPKFHVDSLMRGNNAKKLEDRWDDFTRAMIIAARLLKSFGLTSRSLAAENVVIPLAYYAWHRRLRPSYVTAHAHERDRALVRAFVARTLLIRGTWTGAVDPVLTASRDTIKRHGSAGFPLAEIQASLSETKAIDATPDLIDELAEVRYGDRRTLPLLSLLFNHMVLDGLPGEVAKDHIFPISRFSGRTPSGMDRNHWEGLRARADRLPNLQLLRDEDNNGKRAGLPKAWLADLSPSARARYARQGVKHVPDLSGCGAFWDKRQALLRAEIEHLLSA